MRVISLLVFITLLFFSCNTKQINSESLSDYVPENSKLIVKLNSLQSLKGDIQNNDFIKKLSSSESFDDINSRLNLLKYITSNEEAILSITENNDFAFISKYSDSILKETEGFNIATDTIPYNKNYYLKHTINSDTLFSTISNYVYIASNSKKLIENIFNYDSNSPKVEQLNLKSSSNGLQVLTKTSNTLFESFTLNDSLRLSDFTEHLVLDLEMSPNTFYLNGITKAKDSTQLIEVFKGNIPQENLIANITPNNSDGFMSLSFNDFNVFKMQLERFQPTDSLNLDTELFNTASEIGVVYHGEKRAVVLRSIDEAATNELLLVERTIEQTYREVPIYNYSNPKIFNTVFNPFILYNRATKYCVLDNYFVFSDSTELLHNIIANYQNQTTISSTTYYKELKEQLSDNASLLMVVNGEALSTIINKNLKDPLSQNLKDYKATALQFIYDTDFAHVNVAISKNKSRASGSAVVEELQIQLDNDILNNPQFVINHRTKQKEIVVQDINNILYLISNTGKILWQKQLNGAVLGEIKQIDMYKNGRLQLAFATTNRVYVIDRNGKDVNPFPLKFNDEITQPLSVFDYDNNKNYRLLITQGRDVFMIDAKGKTVLGFTFKKANDNIIHQPQHLRVGRKDYLLFKTTNKLHILDRTGRTRVLVKQSHKYSNKPIFLYKEKFITTSNDGHLITIDAKGNSIKENINLKEEHHIFATSKTLVTLNENSLTIKGKTVELEFGNYTTPEIFYINDKIYVAVTDLQSKKVYLYDSQAKLLPNFPVYANSKIKLDNIDKDRALEFVTKDQNNSILLYEMN